MTYGESLTPTNHWKSSMMANASKDPFWRAVVSEEVKKFPELAKTIETTCTRCHAPLGNVQSKYEGKEHFSMAEVKQNSLWNDGVSCTLCHQIQPANLGHQSSYSGGFEIKPGRVIFGPYPNPLKGLMKNTIGFEAEYSPHMNEAALCGTCHTLFTPYLDDNNQIAGIFPEQTPFIEWKNSKFSSEGTPCQSCHMTPTTDSIDISTTPPPHKVLRSPFWRHTFVGPNVWMGKILRDNITKLKVTSQPEYFDSTINRAYKLLTEQSIKLEIFPEMKGDLLTTKVKIENLAGHKFPTGIPYRRMWIHYTVKDKNEKVVFESGGWDDEGRITGVKEKFQDHYNVITEPYQVQVYEGIFQDVNKKQTYTLLRAASYMKDNRLPPAGFTTQHISYDTIKIVGNAANDPDFNRNEIGEGTGSDFVIYRTKVNGAGEYTVYVEVVYQSVAPELIDYLYKNDTEEINEFYEMYKKSPNLPVVMKTVMAKIP